MIRLVVSDMDGTLLGRDGRISERNIAAVREIQRRGIRFLLCTGRGYEDARIPAERAGIACDVICMNGAAVYDKDGLQLGKCGLDYDKIRYILSCCEGENVFFDFMTDRGSFTTASREELARCFEDRIFLPTATVEAVREIAGKFHYISERRLMEEGLEFFKVSVIHREREVLERIKGRLFERGDLSVVSSFETNMEITATGADKGNALLSYAALNGIGNSEIMALGDSENDYSMLSLKLRYTVAMENGMESVKRVARLKTRSNEEDGVAFAIETLILSEKALASC